MFYVIKYNELQWHNTRLWVKASHYIPRMCITKAQHQCIENVKIISFTNTYHIQNF
jgi:hypothetical protein